MSGEQRKYTHEGYLAAVEAAMSDDRGMTCTVEVAAGEGVVSLRHGKSKTQLVLACRDRRDAAAWRFIAENHEFSAYRAAEAVSLQGDSAPDHREAFVLFYPLRATSDALLRSEIARWSSEHVPGVGPTSLFRLRDWLLVAQSYYGEPVMFCTLWDPGDWSTWVTGEGDYS